jgi:myo-inositol 2-dehydrogenase/D-chiro-inositol 1-dehydrogenase
VRAGVYDPDRARTEAFATSTGHRPCDSENEVLDSCDAVYVCTWTSEHRRLVDVAAARGLAIFCEKPLAVDLETAEHMAATVADAGILNQVGLVLRRSPAYHYARRLLTDPAAGRVMAVVFRDDQFIPIQGHYASTWRSDRLRVGSGTLLEHSIHDVDMLRFLIGDVVQVSAFENNFHEYEGVEDVVTATMTFDGGALGTLTSIWHDNLSRPSLRRVEVFCERRMVTIGGDDRLGPVQWIDHDGTGGEVGGEQLAAMAADLVGSEPNPDAAFLRGVVAGRPCWPDFAVAVQAHRIVDAMYRSARAGGGAERVAVDG